MDLRLEEALSFSLTSPKGRMNGDRNFEIKIGGGSVKILTYYIRTAEGFRVLEEKPAEGEYGTLEIKVELHGFFEGPTVFFQEVGPHFKGELLGLARPGAIATVTLELPQGALVARDGVGDWVKLKNLSVRESHYPDR